MITELIPVHTNQKSFYGKAKVIYDNPLIQLRSYDTIVAIANGELNRVIFPVGYWSRTTNKHTWEFMIFLKDHCGYNDLIEVYWKICENEKIKSLSKFLDKVEYIDFQRMVYKLNDDRFSKGI